MNANEAQRLTEQYPGVVLIEYFGGPRDGLVYPCARSFLSRKTPLRLTAKTEFASHAYDARKPWQGEATITVYHRRALRVVG